MPDRPTIRDLGVTAYDDTRQRMRRFTTLRADVRRDIRAGGRPVGDAPSDEIWLTGHAPVYTLGLDGNTRHLHDPGSIPVIVTERGGQVTYHGPGQVLAYLLIDLRSRRLGARDLVCRAEAGVIDCLAASGITGIRQPGAPGIYVRRGGGIAKIASVGLKIADGFSYHGVALNGRMDLTPFDRIDPCGHPGLQMTDVFTQASTDTPFDLPTLAARLGKALADAIGR